VGHQITQAVILAGGKGTRLGEKTRETPKPLLPVGSKPFLEYLIWNLARQGITRLVLCVGYKAECIQAHFGDGLPFGVSLKYSVEQTPLDTGGALRLAHACLDDRFFVLNGDTLFDVDYQAQARLLESSGASGAIALRRVPDSGRYGAVETFGPYVTGFKEKSAGGSGLINGGIYALRREALDALPAAPCSLERHLLPTLAADGGLRGLACDGFFLDIGLPETLAEAETALPAWQRLTQDTRARRAA